MNYTTNYSLKKPLGTENYDIEDHNGNMDLIDAALKPAADPAQAPSGLAGTLTQWVSWITNRIKAITGETNWYDAPDTTLAGAKTHIDNLSNPHGVTASQAGAVPATRTVNSKALSADITLSASDVSAVPTTRTVNSKALSSNITLTAADVSAVATSGAETVAGVKTFSSFPVTPSSSPTTSYQAANKYYVDTVAAGCTPLRATLTSITASATLALSHAGQRLKINSASAVTVTVPPNSSVAFTIGEEIELAGYGSGTVTVAAGSGVTIRSRDSNLVLDGRYAVASLVKIDTNEWLLTGALTSA